MEPSPAVVTVRFNKFLPYWAVLQTDVRQTFRSWVYRLWVLMTVVAAGGFLLYRVGLHKEAGLFQSAAAQCGDLFRVMVVGSLALVVVLAVSAVSAERGTVADSVLSRGISRHQYFLAKWHARLFVVTVTFAVLAAGVLTAGYFLFRSDAETDLTVAGGLAAVVAVVAVLAVIVSWGVVIGALSNGTVLGITVFWLVLYGAGFLLSLLPEPWPSPDRELGRLKFVLRGQYNEGLLLNVVAASAALSLAAAVVGLVGQAGRVRCSAASGGAAEPSPLAAAGVQREHVRQFRHPVPGHVRPAQVHPGGDLADLVAYVAEQLRAAGVIDDEGRPAVPQALAHVPVGCDRLHPEHLVHDRPVLAEHLPLPQQPRRPGDGHGPPRPGREDRPARGEPGRDRGGDAGGEQAVEGRAVGADEAVYGRRGRRAGHRRSSPEQNGEHAQPAHPNDGGQSGEPTHRERLHLVRRPVRTTAVPGSARLALPVHLPGVSRRAIFAARPRPRRNPRRRSFRVGMLCPNPRLALPDGGPPRRAAPTNTGSAGL
jgi:ABC-2 type transport system permease protein